MHTHKINVNNKNYHITTTMIPSLICLEPTQRIRLVVEQDDGTFVCEETIIGPIQEALNDYTIKQLNRYANRLCNMKKQE